MEGLIKRLSNVIESNNSDNNTLVNMEAANYILNVIKELEQLKIDAYYMRFHIHQEGFDNWLPSSRKLMEKIIYDENNKLKR